jgi:uncharacterized membrane protein YphA (DoxX/SURF4 family)
VRQDVCVTSDERAPLKRPAFELPTEPEPPAADREMKRPIATTSGAALVLLRVAAGIAWMLSVAFGWEGWLQSYTGELSGDSSDQATGQLTPAVLGVSLTVFLVATGLVLAVELTFGLLILRGRNFPRMVVMIISVLSISTAFAGWWVQGQDIRFSTTLVTLALDILVLLALSSRSAAAYARRRERS